MKSQIHVASWSLVGCSFLVTTDGLLMLLVLTIAVSGAGVMASGAAPLIIGVLMIPGLTTPGSIKRVRLYGS